MSALAHARSALGWYIVARLIVDVPFGLLMIASTLLSVYGQMDDFGANLASQRLWGLTTTLAPWLPIALLLPAWHLARAYASTAARAAVLAGAALIPLLGLLPVLGDGGWMNALMAERPLAGTLLVVAMRLWHYIAVPIFFLLAWRLTHAAPLRARQDPAFLLTRRALGWFVLAYVALPNALQVLQTGFAWFGYGNVDGTPGLHAVGAILALSYLVPGWYLYRAQRSAPLQATVVAGTLLALFAALLKAGIGYGLGHDAIAHGPPGGALEVLIVTAEPTLATLRWLPWLLLLWVVWRGLGEPAAQARLPSTPA